MIQHLIFHALIYIVTGAAAGLIAGILGIGGGMVIVPALLYIFQNTQDVPSALQMHVAAGSSLAIMIFTAQASVRAHLRKGGILWNAYYQLQYGLIVGAIMGAALADRLPTQWLKMLLSIFLLCIVAEMLFHPDVPHRDSFPKAWVNRFVSFAIGFKSGLLGIGGGALIIPYLTYCGVERRQTVGVSAMCTFTIGFIGMIAFMVTGSNEPGLPAWSTGYVYWPAVFGVAIPSMIFAPMGAHLTYRLPVGYLKYGFMVVLTVAAVSLLR
jgi:uncharacterized membrane protein YfcA